MNTQQRLHNGLIALALAGFIAPVSARAQAAEAPNKVVTLATDAVTAKEEGNLKLAKAKLEELLSLSPNDEGAKEMLAEVNKAILATPAPAAEAAAPVAAEAPKADAPVAPAAEPAKADEPAKPLTALEAAAEKNLNLFREVSEAIVYAEECARKGDIEEARKSLDLAAAALPKNAAGQEYQERIALTRQKIAAQVNSDAQGGLTGLVHKTNADETRQAKDRISEARKLIAEGRSQTSAHRYEDANATLEKAAAMLPTSGIFDVARVELKKARIRLLEGQYEDAINERDLKAAEKYVETLEVIAGKDDSRAKKLRQDLTDKRHDPHFKSITEISPDFAVREKKARELLAKGRAQYLYGDYLGALETYNEVLQYQPLSTEAKALSIRIRETLHEKSGAYNKEMTKKKLLESVDNSWAMAEAFIKDTKEPTTVGADDPLTSAMKAIKVPECTIPDMPLDQVVPMLSEVSLTYDKQLKGVNIVLIDPDKKNPKVSLTMRDVSFNRLLEQVLRQVNYSYTINNGIVEVRPDSGNLEVETEFFPLAQGAVTRMTGAGSKPTGGGAADPFATGTGGGDGENPHNASLKRYFRGVGMEFDDAKGYALQYDGSQLIVTHNRRTLERVRSILRKYSDVRQVSIETKFIEVNQGALNQVAANWTMTNTKTVNGQEVTQLSATTGNRTLGSAFQTGSTGNQGSITQADIPATSTTDALGNPITIAAQPGRTTPITNVPPTIPGGPTYGGSNQIGVFGSGAPSNFAGQFTTSFGIGGYDVNLYIQALEQTTGSDLMAAPSLTVKDATTATIKIAQLLRYPESYGQIQAQVSQGNNGGGLNGGGGGGGGTVAITAGTPQDFTEKEVGVILEVTPTVAADGESIELDLKPKITEFEGFVEYGGTSVAIASGTTVTVPSGFYQPIFSVRDVQTKVTVFDGATVVIGGLTREEVKTIHDKVPVLGDMPLIGKLFRSDGKTSTKRNLMIFVTANLISPTGSQMKGSVGNLRSGTTFQNPTLVSPSGSKYRAPVEATKETTEAK